MHRACTVQRFCVSVYMGAAFCHTAGLNAQYCGNRWCAQVPTIASYFLPTIFVCSCPKWSCLLSPSARIYYPPAITPSRERSLGPESIGKTRRQRNFLQADLHCVILWYRFVVQSPPPPWGGGRPDKRGGVAREGVYICPGLPFVHTFSTIAVGTIDF